MRMLDSLYAAVPTADRILAPLGGLVAATLTLGDANTLAGLGVALLTGLVLVPRAVLAWREMWRTLRGEDEDGEEE